jgi:metallo-beta-lactamase family protein
MKFTSYGAARQVTGSMHLLEMGTPPFKLLLDCGLDYEDRNNLEQNASFPFSADSIDAVILTHTHIDHVGRLPILVKQGFKGDIFCTGPTAYHLEKMWVDSIKIQSKGNRKSKRDKSNPVFFTNADIKKSLDLIKILEFEETVQLSDEVSIQLFESGHIIGAASVRVNYNDGKNNISAGFTGDLGNFGQQLIVDPKPMPNLDYLISESTYGSRLHKEMRSAEETLKEYITETCVNNGGKLIIPAFSVGRTQAILFVIRKLMERGEIPNIRVFADSPLAFASTHIHNKFYKYLNQEARKYKNKYGSLFEFSDLYVVEDEEDKMELDYFQKPYIIVSSAGMLEGGRIQEHITNHIRQPNCTILLAGFCAPGTVGAKLLEEQHYFYFKGKQYPVFAKVAQTDVFSAHADANALMTYFDKVQNSKLKKILLVHGDKESQEQLKILIQQKMAIDVYAPEKGETLELV